MVSQKKEISSFVVQTIVNTGSFRYPSMFVKAEGEETFSLAWECARPNAIVTLVALYDQPQVLPLPDMYGKNLTFKTGGVDGCNSEDYQDKCGSN